MPSTTDLAFDTEGNGPPVLLIQGVGVAGKAWKPQVDALAEHFSVCWFDNRGIGNSPGAPGSIEDMGRDTLGLLDALGWEQVHLVGHSLGGVIAQQVAVLAPERVRSLSLLCTFARGRAAIDLSPSGLWRTLRTLVGTAAMRRTAFYDLVADPALPFTEARAQQLEEAFGRSLHALPPAAQAQVMALARADLREPLRGLDLPALVISAAHDHVAPCSEGPALAALLGGSFEEVPGGHAVTVQDAARINDLLRTFLGGLPAI